MNKYKSKDRDINIDIDEEKMYRLMTVVPKVTKFIKEEVDKISIDPKEKIILVYILIDSLHRSEEMTLWEMGIKIEEYK